MASKHSSAMAAYDTPPGKRARVAAPYSLKPALNGLDCNLDFTIEVDGITGSAPCNEGFAYCWSGARANVGVKEGKYCFGCKVLENQSVSMQDTAKDQQNVCRVGLSRGDVDVGSLGESVNSFGYGGTGKFSHKGFFSEYGGRFTAGDTIICAVDLQNPSRAQVSFSKNGKLLGVAMAFDAGPTTGAVNYKKAFFPHILLKNVKVRVLLSIDHGLEPLEGFKPWDQAVDDGNAVEGPKAVGSNHCEVIMMVGLPASGKTTWAERWAREHPEKRYMLLGTNLVLDQMKVPGLMRKKNYGERFDLLMDRASKIFNKLMDRASKTPRNYIIDQTNVYRSARVRKLKPFRSFRKVAVVVIPRPEELKWRSRLRAQEMGKEVPEEAVNEMLANFVIPTAKGDLNSTESFDEVRFVELQRGDAERCLDEMKSALPARPSKKSEDRPAASFQGSSFGRDAREGSDASLRGSFSSGYEFQTHNAREPQRLHGLHSPLSQMPYESALQVPYASASALQTNERSHSILDRSLYAPPPSYLPGQANLYNRQGAFSSPYSRDTYSQEGAHGSYQGGAPNVEKYGRESSVYSQYGDQQGYSRESSLPSYPWSHTSPYMIPSAAPYGSRSGGDIGYDMPGQSLHLTSLGGGYVGGDAGRQLQSQTYGQYGDASRAGQGMPPMGPLYRY